MVSLLRYKERALRVSIGAALLATLTMLVAISTDHWVSRSVFGGFARDASAAIVISQRSGLFRICRYEMFNRTRPVIYRDHCTLFKFFPSESDVDKDPEIDENIIDYRRAQTAFAVIALMLAGLGFTFALYSLREPRYMFKRLTAMMFFMTAVSILISAEVFLQSIEYEEAYLEQRYPARATHSLGFSFAFAIFSLVVYACCAVVFIVYSRKLKGERATSEQEARENEPVIIGRL